MLYIIIITVININNFLTVKILRMTYWMENKDEKMDLKCISAAGFRDARP